jgi:hypothetical protein
MTLKSRGRWLKLAADLTIAFGILIAAAALPALSLPTSFLVDVIFFPLDGGQPVDADAARLLAAITGGLMTGLGVTIYLIAAELLPKEPLLARRMIVAASVSWFVVDSSMSIAAGAWLNAVFKRGLFALVLRSGLEHRPAAAR